VNIAPAASEKYYLRNLPADTPMRKLGGAIKARWICEQAHQQVKEGRGLDHCEVRSWSGLHRHALMTMIAYAFLQSRRLQAAGREKRVAGPAPQPSLPAVRQAILDHLSRPPPTLSSLQRHPRSHLQQQSAKVVLNSTLGWCIRRLDKRVGAVHRSSSAF